MRQHNGFGERSVLARFGENYMKIRLRSHPEVAAAHYRDVLHPV